MSKQSPNRNILWARTFVDELARCGLTDVCIAPGSRSTPLVIAFAEHPSITCHSLIDERGAAFFALGLAQSSGRPVAVLCSSGTATVNFHPAIVEAKYAHVPLLVLTADRPPEARESGANQTIDQVKQFGDHVLWSVDVALPEADPPDITLRYLRTLACRAMALADGLVRGAVHLNFPFRKPLEPTPVAGDRTQGISPRAEGRAHTRITHGVLHPAPQQIEALAGIIRDSRRGLIVCGSRTPRDEGFAVALGRLAQATGYPVLADAISGVRFSPQVRALGAYENVLSALDIDPPDLVIQFGAPLTSGIMERYLGGLQGHAHVVISANGVWTDPHHTATEFIWADPARVCAEVAERLATPPVDGAWRDRLLRADEIAWQALEAALGKTWFDGSAVATACHAVPDGAQVMVASSLAVRHMEQYAAPAGRRLRVYANRGASGIDGTLSCAFGIAQGDPDTPTVLITGDLAFYHDLNGLIAAERLGIHNLVIVLINNDGGGIFNRLPIAAYDPPFTQLFLTPHGLTFEPVVRMFGLEYRRADDHGSLRAALHDAIRARRATVIEVLTRSPDDQAHRDAINRTVSQQLKQLSG